MAISDEELRVALSNEEPDYPALAARLDESDVPRVRALAERDDLALATKAIYLASLLASDSAHEIVVRAADSPTELKRIASATGLPNLPPLPRERAASRLADEPNPAVAKMVLRAIDQPSPQLVEKIRAMESRATVPEIRALAREKLRDR
ncbi:MAG: hypothetical protein ABW194_11350 [Novosphingobium sp.]